MMINNLWGYRSRPVMSFDIIGVLFEWLYNELNMITIEII